MLQLHWPSGGDVSGGDKQYIWYLFGLTIKKTHTIQAISLDQARYTTLNHSPSVAIIAEQQLIIVVGCAANRTVFTFDALPSVAFHRYYHIWCELKA